MRILSAFSFSENKKTPGSLSIRTQDTRYHLNFAYAWTGALIADDAVAGTREMRGNVGSARSVTGAPGFSYVQNHARQKYVTEKLLRKSGSGITSTNAAAISHQPTAL